MKQPHPNLLLKKQKEICALGIKKATLAALPAGGAVVRDGA